jgi:hypothetical protein
MSYKTYYCEHCRSPYGWVQQEKTPGYCGAKCRSADTSRQAKKSFDQIQLDRIASRIPASAKNADTLAPRVPLDRDLPPPREQRCECCSITEHNGLPIKFKWFHIDGNVNNDNPPNLRLLCPNCFSQQSI